MQYKQPRETCQGIVSSFSARFNNAFQALTTLTISNMAVIEE